MAWAKTRCEEMSTRTTKTTLKKEQFLEVLEKKMGIVSQATKAMGLDRTTPYRWMREDEDFKDAVSEVQNVVLDFAEGKLYELVQDKNPTAVIFLLKTKGKNRGYIERTEITGMDGGGLDVRIEVVRNEGTD
jgi:hypothetical protein